MSSVLCDLCNDCTCENVACGRCICLHFLASNDSHSILTRPVVQDEWVYFVLESLSHVHHAVFSFVMRSSGMSAVIACASVRDRIHSSSWNS